MLLFHIAINVGMTLGWRRYGHPFALHQLREAL